MQTTIYIKWKLRIEWSQSIITYVSKSLRETYQTPISLSAGLYPIRSPTNHGLDLIQTKIFIIILCPLWEINLKVMH